MGNGGWLKELIEYMKLITCSPDKNGRCRQSRVYSSDMIIINQLWIEWEWNIYVEWTENVYELKFQFLDNDPDWNTNVISFFFSFIY